MVSWKKSAAISRRHCSRKTSNEKRGTQTMDPSVTAAAQQSFDLALQGYKATLIPLYQKKAQIIASRQSLLFLYITSWRSSVETIMTLAANTSLDGTNVTGPLHTGEVAFVIGNTIMGCIPMVDAKGRPGYLSPANVWFDPDPMYKDAAGNPMPMYKVVEGQLRTTPDDPNWLLNNWYLNCPSFRTKTPLTLPPSYLWAVEALEMADFRDADDVNIPAAIARISRPFQGTDIEQLGKQGRDLLIQIIAKTNDMFTVQWQIDDIVDRLKATVDMFKDQIPNMMSLDQILLMLQQEAVAPTPAQAAAQSSKWPWVVAVIGGLALISGKD
jgi:hypothetical protein